MNVEYFGIMRTFELALWSLKVNLSYTCPNLQLRVQTFLPFICLAWLPSELKEPLLWSRQPKHGYKIWTCNQSTQAAPGSHSVCLIYSCSTLQCAQHSHLFSLSLQTPWSRLEKWWSDFTHEEIEPPRVRGSRVVSSSIRTQNPLSGLQPDLAVLTFYQKRSFCF